jgi:3-oxoacyl-[acyl-carrier-protein] synthase-3
MPEGQPRAYITGLGTYVPERRVTNKDFEETLDTTHEWIRERTGIEARYFAAKGEATSDLGIAAGRKALKDAGVAPEDVDLVILGTFTPDHPFPATSCFVQDALGCVNAGAFDIQAACTSWVATMSTATMWIQGGGAKTILMVGSDASHRYLDPQDRATAVLFGDGASACVVQAKPAGSPGIEVVSTFLKADGSGAMCLHMPAGGSRLPASRETVEARQHYVHMAGRATYKFAVRALAECVTETLKRADISLDEVTRVIPHQANLRIIEASARRLGVDLERYVINIQKYGNTVSASVGLALHEAREDGRFEAGDTAVLVAMGAGLTWGGLAIRWNE